jgi:hypothetical protein
MALPPTTGILITETKRILLVLFGIQAHGSYVAAIRGIAYWSVLTDLSTRLPLF